MGVLRAMMLVNLLALWSMLVQADGLSGSGSGRGREAEKGRRVRLALSPLFDNLLGIRNQMDQLVASVLDITHTNTASADIVAAATAAAGNADSSADISTASNRESMRRNMLHALTCTSWDSVYYMHHLAQVLTTGHAGRSIAEVCRTWEEYVSYILSYCMRFMVVMQIWLVLLVFRNGRDVRTICMYNISMCLIGVIVPHPVFFVVVYVCYNAFRKVLPGACACVCACWGLGFGVWGLFVCMCLYCVWHMSLSVCLLVCVCVCVLVLVSCVMHNLLTSPPLPSPQNL